MHKLKHGQKNKYNTFAYATLSSCGLLRRIFVPSY